MMMLHLITFLVLLSIGIHADPVPSLPGFGPLVESAYSGYLSTSTNNATNTGQIFYLYFGSRSTTPDNDPVVLWLQGGPGCSGFLGLFTELGPYHLQADGTLITNPYSWNTNAHLVFFDQPIGTGYSATNDSSQIVTDEPTMGIDGYNALLAFFQFFPNLQGREFYISGESYAGKYIPYLATQITQGNLQGNAPINLKGLLIGDGWTDPLPQTQVYSDQAYNLGLIDENEKDYVDKILFPDCQTQTLAQNWSAAQVSCDGLLAWIVNASGGINEDDVREFGGDDKDNRLVTYLNNPDVLSALHVPAGTIWSECNGTVAQYLSTDEMKSAVHLLPDLFARYRVLLYNGQFDMNCGVVGTQLYMSRLLPDQYRAAKKRYWKVGNDIAGYVRDITNNLSILVVSGAGHLVPKTQPVHALDMLTRVLNNQPF